ncbi:hypothetical protein [Endothiovibrio diazotrophicus]
MQSAPPVDELSPFYRREGEHYLIEIKLSDLQRLFNSLDPSPFIEKDLNDDAEAYIVEVARELPSRAKLKLVIYLPEAQTAERQDEPAMAVRHYFDYRYQALGRDLRHKLRNGRKSLVVGVVVLFFGIAGYQAVGRFGGDGVWWEILAEGLMIGGWVAMWRPLETFLYDWWPIDQNRKLYNRLRTMVVEIRDTKRSSPVHGGVTPQP